MKKFIKFIAFVLTTSIVTAGFGQDKMANNIDNSNIALEGYSPVSYLDLGIAQRGNKAHKSEYKQVLYYFTSAEQKAAFDNDPKKYLPQYGGYCAFGVYAGAKFRVDPQQIHCRRRKVLSVFVQYRIGCAATLA